MNDAANKLIFDFLWESKPPKIKKSTIIGEKYRGGLKMVHVDFGIMESALKISWAQRIRQNSGAKWKVLPEHLLGHLGDCSFLLSCNYDINLLQVNNLPPFCLFVLKYWQDYRSLWADNFTQIHNQIIWNNSNIVINQKTVFLKHWYQKGIIRLRDLLDDVDFTFLSLEKFQQKFQVQVPFTIYYGLIHSIPSSWRRELKTTNPTNTEDNCSKVCCNKNFVTKTAYAAILDYYFQAPTAESKILWF